jgi:hypothetical protein
VSNSGYGLRIILSNNLHVSLSSLRPSKKNVFLWHRIGDSRIQRNICGLKKPNTSAWQIQVVVFGFKYYSQIS